MRKIEVSTNKLIEFELGDTAPDIQRSEEKEQRGGGGRETTEGGDREGGSQEGGKSTATEEGVAIKRPRTERSDSEMDTEGGGEVGTSQSQSRFKKGHMTSIYLTDSDEEAIVDFLKDHEELHDKINNKARKELLWERFTSSYKLSKLCKTWFESQRTCYGKLTQSKSGQATKEMTGRKNWIQDKFNFSKTHIRR